MMGKDSLNIAFFGSSLVSAYWNGAATYYRGIIKALNAQGHQITFYEPDAFERQQHRDIDDPDWATVVVYEANEESVLAMIREAASADIIVKASGVGVFDTLLEKEVLNTGNKDQLRIFWDVDAPATLGRIEANPDDHMRTILPEYDLVLTYGGGDPVISRYRSLGARDCIPVYNALDPDTHHPATNDEKFNAHLAFLGNRLPDREERVEEFFLRAATLAPDMQFLLGGSGWGDKNLPENVKFIGHVYTSDHNSFNCTPRMVLNISRESMATNGFSPATRVFEAAGAGACLITDAWEGIELFLEPGKEVLVAHNAEDVANLVKNTSEDEARRIGNAALRRVLKEHTYTNRAEQLQTILFNRLNIGKQAIA